MNKINQYIFFIILIFLNTTPYGNSDENGKFETKIYPDHILIGDIVYITIQYTNTIDTPVPEQNILDLINKKKLYIVSEQTGREEIWRPVIQYHLPNHSKTKKIQENFINSGENITINRCYAFPEICVGIGDLSKRSFWRDIQDEKLGTIFNIAYRNPDDPNDDFFIVGKIVINSRSKEYLERIRQKEKIYFPLNAYFNSLNVSSEDVYAYENGLSPGTLRNSVHTLRVYYEVVEKKDYDEKKHAIQEYKAWLATLDPVEQGYNEKFMYSLLNDYYSPYLSATGEYYGPPKSDDPEISKQMKELINSSLQSPKTD